MKQLFIVTTLQILFVLFVMVMIVVVTENTARGRKDKLLFSVEACIGDNSDDITRVVMWHHYKGYGCYNASLVERYGVGEVIDLPLYWFN